VRRLEPAAMINPGEWLGVLGGGQLGRMFCMAAQSLGYRVCVLDPDKDSPAGAVAERQIRADYTDPAGLAQLSALCQAVTTEFENVPAQSLKHLAHECVVSPRADAVAIAQDRLAEKRYAMDCGLSAAPHQRIATSADVERADAALVPGVLKSARLGYDGKGQVRVARLDDLAEAWQSLARVECVLEKWMPIEREVSVVACRGLDGASAVFPVSENEHRGGILAVSIVPARIDPALAARAQAEAIAVAERLDYVGVLCLEFFVLGDGRLLFNEMAPRPHNSGHYTIDACTSSQFEQQARALAGAPLGDTSLMAPAVMLNLLGDLWFDDGRPRVPNFEAVLRVAGAHLHLYGKREARAGRKMGHVTVTAPTLEQSLDRAREVCAILGLEPAA
jgi:5-(carboxyamino)imidazole ribonucleotide synthase